MPSLLRTVVIRNAGCARVCALGDLQEPLAACLECSILLRVLHICMSVCPYHLVGTGTTGRTREYSDSTLKIGLGC